jgi:CBS domain-containing protein
MVDAGGSGLPGIGGGGAVVGIITEADFIETEAGRTIGRQRLFDTVFGGKRTTIPSTVGAAMTRSPVVAIG